MSDVADAAGILAATLEGYRPHGFCLSWEPALVWLHVVSDAVTAASYFSIPIALAYFAYRRKDLRFRWVFVLFGIFILACGTTHAMGIWTLWNPSYWADGIAKAVTAVASVATAILLWPLIPRALALPTPADLTETNARLEAEIAERKATEESLRHERDFTRTVIEGLPGIFYVITAQGRIEMWNSNLETVTGYDADEIARMSPMDFFEKEEKPLVAEKVTSVFAGGVNEVEASLVTRSGKHIPYFFTGRRLGADHGAKLIGVGIDISTRRHLEAALLRSNQELKRFADIAAHHLMEPARRLSIFSQRLRPCIVDRVDDPDARASLDYIEEQANRLRVMLRDIQLYLVADHSLGETGTVDAQKIVHAAIERLAERILNAGAVVTVGELPPALIDAPRLANIFDVLLTNALQYRRTDVPPDIRPLEIRIDGQFLGEATRYRVADNGIGIPLEYRERVFQVFERLRPRSESDGDSTGVGLAIVHRIVASRGGRAWIEETPGGGTTVVFELPTGDKA